jgi:hypothetical protein
MNLLKFSNRGCLNRTGRRLGFETLESRRLTAITTSLNNGALNIQGDTAAEDIAIVGSATPGQVTVTGRNGTMVDGVVNGSTTANGVRADLIIQLLGGDNVVSLDNLYIAGSINVFSGDQSDVITLGATNPVSPAGDLVISTGNGNDQVYVDTTVYNVFVIGKLVVYPGQGADIVNMYGASALNDIVIDDHDGHNSILVNGTTTASTLLVTTGEGNNQIGILFSAASAFVNVDFNRTNSVIGKATNVYIDTVYSGAGMYVQDARGFANIGSSTVSIFRASAFQLSVATGVGSDSVHLYGNLVYPSNVAMRTDGGNDAVQITYCVLGQDLIAQLQDGDDTLSLVGNQVARFGTFDGGTGTNRLTQDANRFGTLSITNFV